MQINKFNTQPAARTPTNPLAGMTFNCFKQTRSKYFSIKIKLATN